MTPEQPGWYLCDCGNRPGYIRGDLAFYWDGRAMLTSPNGQRSLLPLGNFRRLEVRCGGACCSCLSPIEFGVFCQQCIDSGNTPMKGTP